MTYRVFKNRLRKAHKSMTIWFNAIVAPMLYALQEYSNLWAEYFGAGAGALLFAVIAVNGALRFKTNSDLADK